MTTARQDFEAWARSQNWICDRNSFGEYMHGTARDGWDAWQAADKAATERERERAAKVCDRLGGEIDMHSPDDVKICANSLAAAIRNTKEAATAIREET